MKNTVKLFSLIIVLAATACSKYNAENSDLSQTVKCISYSDSLTDVKDKTLIETDSSRIIFKNNIYKSALTVEG